MWPTAPLRRVFLLVPAQGFVASWIWISSFKDFQPSQTPASFSVDQVMKKLETAGAKNRYVVDATAEAP